MWENKRGEDFFMNSGVGKKHFCGLHSYLTYLLGLGLEEKFQPGPLSFVGGA